MRPDFPGQDLRQRTGLAELIGYVREGDLVKVASMDRLGRDTRDLYAIVDELTDKGCSVQFVSERITLDKSGTSPMDELMLGILAAFAEFERRRIKERQAKGIALAKARGKCVQAPNLSDADVQQAQAMIEMGVPKAEVARTFRVSRQTLYASLRRIAPSRGTRAQRTTNTPGPALPGVIPIVGRPTKARDSLGGQAQLEAPWVSFRGQDATGASERTYVLSMPMQPVPATEVLKAWGLEHSGQTWDQILELGFTAEVRRVELDPEADVFMAYGTRPALKEVQTLLDRLTQDADVLMACLERIAGDDGALDTPVSHHQKNR